MVQEALHNCARHSGAATVRIRVKQEHDRLVLSIRDDGRGFDARHTKGLGLLGIQERVTRLGGNCRIESQPGGGATVSVELPFRIEESEQNRDASVRETHSHPVG